MNARDDAKLHSEFSARCGEAREALWKHMADRGLHRKDGWRIHEVARQIDGHTEIVMTPIHLHLDAPTDLECLCAIDEPGDNISSDCRT